jgi:hypothetical protein
VETDGQYLDLAGSDIADQLGKLNRVARAFDTTLDRCLTGVALWSALVGCTFRGWQQQRSRVWSRRRAAKRNANFVLDLLDGHDCTAGFQADGISYSETHASSP